MTMSKKEQQGQSVIELLIALVVVLVVILALVSVVTTAVSTTDFARKKAQAANYAQEGMEEMRIYRDAGWTAFSNRVGTSKGDKETYALAGSTPSGSDCPTTPNLASVFIRCVTFERIAANQIGITVTVSWVDSKGTHKSELSSYFTQW